MHARFTLSALRAGALPLPSRRRRGTCRLAQIAVILVLFSAVLPARAQEPAPAKSEVQIVYLSAAGKERAIAGARLGLVDDNGTGRFLGQSFDLKEATVGDEPIVGKEGSQLVVADLPAPQLLALADLPAMRDATILDVATSDDELRGKQCRANLLHILPSRAMLADALMQFLVAKNWRRIMLLAGREPEDALYAEAMRRSAKKFRVSIAADKAWSFNPAAQQADTGHFQVNTEVADATRGEDYDVLVVADEAGNFGDQLAYRTDKPRPIAGTQGLVPTAWSPVFDEYASTQLQNRFRRAAQRPMNAGDYAGWLALRAIGEAATRSGNTDPRAIGAFMRSEEFSLAGYKGAPLSFRAWDGQLRQPVLLADDRSLVSISPQPGFLHQFNELDTLGTDRPETLCRLK
jgi:ABC transporter substrate binding protein (PQQ-dependent alcohol dehydrogenase system)